MKLEQESDAVVTAHLLARGLCEIYDRITQEGDIVNQGPSLPPMARRALARLSKHCVLDGVEDLGSSVHLLMHAAAMPMSSWGLPSFAGVTLTLSSVVVEVDGPQPLSV